MKIITTFITGVPIGVVVVVEVVLVADSVVGDDDVIAHPPAGEPANESAVAGEERVGEVEHFQAREQVEHCVVRVRPDEVVRQVAATTNAT